MEDFIAFCVVLLAVSAVFGFALLFVGVLAAVAAIAVLMHFSAWVYRRCGGKDWRC